MRNNKHAKRTLTLDKEHKKFLGVCAGIAHYLEVEPWTVRLVFLVSILFGGWFLIPIYFIAWFCLDEKPGEGLSSLTESQPMRHFKSVDYKKQLFRNTEEGKFLGICAGVADYLEVNVFAVRLVYMVLVLTTAALPLIIYFGAYFILEEKPSSRLHDSLSKRDVRRARRENRKAQKAARAAGRTEFNEQRDQRYAGFTNTTAESQEQDLEEGAMGESAVPPASKRPFTDKVYSKRSEFKYCTRKFATLQDRLAKMEAYVTSNQFRLHREFKNI